MSITRRLFLRNTAVVSAAVAGAVPTVAAEPEMSPRDRAIWHMRELERLVIESGAADVQIMAVSSYAGSQKCKTIGIHYTGRLIDRDGVFGGSANG